MKNTEGYLILAVVFLPSIGWLIGHNMGADQVRREFQDFQSRVEWPKVCDDAIARAREDTKFEQEMRIEENSQSRD